MTLYESLKCFLVLYICLILTFSQAISAILKYADNIARVYAHAAAMLITMLLSVFFFGAPPTPQLIISIAIVSSSTFLYNQKLDEVSRSGPYPSIAENVHIHHPDDIILLCHIMQLRRNVCELSQCTLTNTTYLSCYVMLCVDLSCWILTEQSAIVTRTRTRY